MTATSLIRHDFLIAKALVSEWKETKQVELLVQRIGHIHSEAIRSHAAATFSLRAEVAEPVRVELLQIVQQIDPALCADLVHLNASTIKVVKQLSTPSIRAYRELKLKYGGKQDADWFSHIPETLIALWVSIPIGILWSMYAATVTAMGVGASFASMITGGTRSELNECADKWTQYAKCIVADPYRFLWTAPMPKISKEEREIIGFVTQKVATPIFVRAMHEAKESDVLHRHIISRSLFFIGGLVATVCRAVDFALGFGAAVVSIMPCLLFSRRINTFAYVQLKSLGVIYDVAAALRGTINPHQFVIR